jgi:hypothetical protein
VSQLERLARLVVRQGWRKGVLGGSTAWTATGGAALVAYLAGRALRREPDVIYCEKLEPGSVLRITHEPPA